MKHTKGKWTVENIECITSNGGCYVVDKDGEDLAKVCGVNEEAIANANLIASVPEMFELLSYLRHVLEGQLLSAEIKQIDSIIAKAGGK